MHKHNIYAKELPEGETLTEVKEEHFAFEGKWDQTDLLIRFHDISFQLLLLMKVPIVLQILVLCVNEADNEQ